MRRLLRGKKCATPCDFAPFVLGVHCVAEAEEEEESFIMIMNVLKCEEV
jgi:hypothetical protein